MATMPPDDQSQGQTPPPSPPPQQPPPAPAPSGGTGYSTPPTSTTNGLAIASLVLGIAGLVFYLCGIASILALVFGYMARNQIDQSGGTQQGRGLTTAGIITGWIGVAFLVIFWVVVIIASAASS
jgi:Domain of unknown function (DUF4190)